MKRVLLVGLALVFSFALMTGLAEKDVYLIAGWSERIFDVLSAIDKGDDALSIINKIDV